MVSASCQFRDVCPLAQWHRPLCLQQLPGSPAGTSSQLAVALPAQLCSLHPAPAFCAHCTSLGAGAELTLGVASFGSYNLCSLFLSPSVLGWIHFIFPYMVCTSKYLFRLGSLVSLSSLQQVRRHHSPTDPPPQIPTPLPSQSEGVLLPSSAGSGCLRCTGGCTWHGLSSPWQALQQEQTCPRQATMAVQRLQWVRCGQSAPADLLGLSACLSISASLSG